MISCIQKHTLQLAAIKKATVRGDTKLNFSHWYSKLQTFINDKLISAKTRFTH